MPGLQDIPGDFTFPLPVVPIAGGTAGSADEVGGFRCPVNGIVTAAYWTPLAAVTANASNYFTLGVRNRKADATGTALPATRSYAATNSVAFVAEAMTLDATAANLLFSAGDVLTVNKVVTGTGLALPQGLVTVHYKIR